MSRAKFEQIAVIRGGEAEAGTDTVYGLDSNGFVWVCLVTWDYGKPKQEGWRALETPYDDSFDE